MEVKKYIMKLFSVKGIEIKLHLSTLFIVGLVGFYAALFYLSLFSQASILEMVFVGIISGVIILFSVLAHELTHSLVALRYGLKVSSIDLYIFGGVSNIEHEPRTPKAEFVIAVVGPLSSIIIGFAFIGLLFIPLQLSSIIAVTFLYSGITNIGLGIFNFLPAFPMDGGRVLRAAIWSRKKDLLSATRIASRVGVLLGYGLVAFGFIESLFLGLLNGFWLIIIGFFITSSARNSYNQTQYGILLSKIKAKDVSGLPQAAIPFNTLISDAIRNYFLVYKRKYFPVIDGDHIVGIVFVSDLNQVPYERRNEVIVGYLMSRISEFATINENQSGEDALNQLNLIQGKPKLLIVKEKDHDGIVGFIGQDEIISALEFAKLNVVS